MTKIERTSVDVAQRRGIAEEGNDTVKKNRGNLQLRMEEGGWEGRVASKKSKVPGAGCSKPGKVYENI